MNIKKIKELSSISHKEWIKIQHKFCKPESIKKINKKHYTKDLLDTKKILDKENITFWLIFGTLLGAIRENDFLKWDDNINIAIYKEDLLPKYNILKNKFISNNFIVRKIPKPKGTKINLYKNNHKIAIEGLYLDPSYKNNKYRLSNKFKHPRKYFEEYGKINFIGETFRVPSPVEKYLKFLYKNWKIPVLSKDLKKGYKWRNKKNYIRN